MNTVIGFACSVSVEMGFKSKHHREKATGAVVHIHNNDKKHIHHKKKGSHSHDKSQSNGQVSSRHESENNKQNCCTDKVSEFHQLEKSVPTIVKVVHPLFITAFAAVYCNINLLPHTDIVRDIKPFVRSYHPPISDIRIAIQSFQI